MERREVLSLIPFTVACMTNYVKKAISQSAPPEDYVVKYSFSSPEPLSLMYTQKVREMLTWIRNTQSNNMLEAAYMIARTKMKGGTCWCMWDMGHGHNIDIRFPGRNGLPDIFNDGYDPQKAKDGDLFLANINLRNIVSDLEKKDIFVIGSPVPWGMDAKGAELIEHESAKVRIRPYSRIWIETNITTHGAVMQIPGITAPVGPVSSIIGMATFWMMVADACRILAREGKSVPVSGDEPAINWEKNTSSIDLYNPLMDDYFETVMSQIEQIGAELGSIHEIARMAVDSVLSGGRVYGYDRYGGFAAEARGRRGGLVLTQGISADNDGNIIGWNNWAGKETPSPKDLIIMGLSKPDDEVDLKVIGTIRKIGAKVVSMGPMTRDNKIPEGRTVPKETDVHVGTMCDTYGLYAIPGFEQKVCPTSGALLNQIFWATCMEIVCEIHHRTGGNVPNVFLSAALKGGEKNMHQMIEIFKHRGY
ncbi:hypothetical protein ACFL1R_03860 [Candidatus Latescibacterota bacterium]